MICESLKLILGSSPVVPALDGSTVLYFLPHAPFPLARWLVGMRRRLAAQRVPTRSASASYEPPTRSHHHRP